MTELSVPRCTAQDTQGGRPSGGIGFCNPSGPNPHSCLAPWSTGSGSTIVLFYKIVVDQSALDGRAPLETFAP